MRFLKRAALTDCPNTTFFSISSIPNKKNQCKLTAMLVHFAKGKSLHRFQAESLGDHVLPSTIDDLHIKHGLNFSRKWVKVPNRFTHETRVMSYWLDGTNLKKARDILGWEATI